MVINKFVVPSARVTNFVNYIREKYDPDFLPYPYTNKAVFVSFPKMISYRY